MKVTIFGGAGFLGSLIATECVDRGFDTIVVDGFLPQTGGRARNLEHLSGKIKLISVRIEDISYLEELITESNVSISAMGWTSHIGAMENPEYDIELNLLSHVRLLGNVPTGARIIYLGSRVQYGDIPGPITENSSMKPVDVQGTNKTAAESYYRILSSKGKFNAISVRIPACFGQNQPVLGPDIGLIGGMIKDLIIGKNIKIYGDGRMRSFLFGSDCARIICDIAKDTFSGFDAYNVGGVRVSIEELAHKLVHLLGRGGYEVQEIPDSIKRIDAGNAFMDESRLRGKLGELTYTNFDEALLSAIHYFKKELSL